MTEGGEESVPTAWFKILDAQFVLTKITQNSTKYYYAFAVLPADAVARLPEACRSAKSFETLKAKVFGLFECIKPELFKKPFSATSSTGCP